MGEIRVLAPQPAKSHWYYIITARRITSDDLLMVPDPESEVPGDIGNGSPGEQFFLGNIL